MKKKKLPKRKVYKTKLEVVNIKMQLAEVKKLRAKAKMYTEGNLSALMRKAALSYVPSKK